MHITFVYAALLALLFVVLSVRTLRMRRRLKIAMGDKGDQAMLRAMRVHSNFAEYAPLGLLLIYFVEESGSHPAYVHALGLSLVVGRALHAYGVSQVTENFRFRVTGMALTLGVLVAASVRLLYAYVAHAAA